MKVLMLNGSCKANGNTYQVLEEAGRQLKAEGIDYEIFQIGPAPVRDCIGCGRCYIACYDAGHQALGFDAEARKPVFLGSKCVGCHLCATVCPVNCISKAKRVAKKTLIFR